MIDDRLIIDIHKGETSSSTTGQRIQKMREEKGFFKEDSKTDTWKGPQRL